MSTTLEAVPEDDQGAGEMSGARKVAVLLMSIGTERAARVLRQLAPEEMSAVLAEISAIGDLEAEVVDDVIEDFAHAATDRRSVLEGGPDLARELLEASVGAEQAAQMLEEINAGPRFAFLMDLPMATVRELLREEHPQTVAVVLAHLDPAKAARVLSGFEEPAQRDIALRIATMDRGHAAAVDAIEEHLAKRTEELLAVSEEDTIGGVKSLIAMLTKSEKAVERAVVEELEAYDAELAEEVRANLFIFEDIVGLEDRAVQQILRQVDTRELAVALKGVEEEVSRKVLSNMSSRAAENLLEEIDMLPSMRSAEIKEARTAIVKVIRTLEDSGDITINRGVDDDDE